MTTWLAGAGLAVAVFFVYLLTFSSTPVGDTFTWLTRSIPRSRAAEPIPSPMTT